MRKARRAPAQVACALATAALLSAPLAHAEDEWWGTDKALHFGVSAGIAGGAYAATSTLSDNRTLRCVGATAAALAAGAAKEAYDAAGYGDPSWRDFTWDALGVAVGVVLAYTVDHFVFEHEYQRQQVKVGPAALVITF
jgi:putative lipoprotein